MSGEKQKTETGNEFRHLTPALSPIEAERVSDAPCLTRFELAVLLNVSVRTVDRMIAAEQLPVRRVRGHVRFLRSDVDRYLHGDASRTGHLAETDLLKTNPAPTAP